MRHLLILIVLVATLVGCDPRGQGDAVTAKVSFNGDIEKLIDAKIAEVVNAKIAETIDVKFAETFEAKAEAKIADTVNAKLADTIDNRLEQQMRDFQGRQNVGMFSGDGIYMLVLVVVVVLILAVVFVIRQWRQSRNKLMLAAITAGVSRAKERAIGCTDGSEVGVEEVLAEIQKHAKKAGVSSELDMLLVRQGSL